MYVYILNRLRPIYHRIQISACIFWIIILTVWFLEAGFHSPLKQLNWRQLKNEGGPFVRQNFSKLQNNDFSTLFVVCTFRHCIDDNCIFLSKANSNNLFLVFRIDWKPVGDLLFLIRPKKNPVILIMAFELGENSKMYTWKFSFHYILPPWRDESSFWRKIGNFEKLIKFIVGKKDHKCNSCSCEPH